MSPSAARASSRIQCRRHLHLHPRRHVLLRAGPHRKPRRAIRCSPTFSIPQNSSGLTINAQGRSRDLAGSTPPTHGRTIGLTRFHQQGRFAADRRQFVHRHSGLGRAAGRRANTLRLRRHSASNRGRPCVSGPEISDLIAAQSAYEMNAKVLSAADNAAFHLQHVPLRKRKMTVRSLCSYLPARGRLAPAFRSSRPSSRRRDRRPGAARHVTVPWRTGVLVGT